jgi:hypothetical protein
MKKKIRTYIKIFNGIMRSFFTADGHSDREGENGVHLHKNDSEAIRQAFYDGQILFQEYCKDYPLEEGGTNREWGLKVSRKFKEFAWYFLKKTKNPEYWRYYYLFVKIEAVHHIIDSAFEYLECKRPFKERFYEPRREVFKKLGIIDAMQALLDGEIDILTISMPPGTGKSTLEIFFLACLAGYYPDDYNLTTAHSAILTKSLYDGVLGVIGDRHTYQWWDLFSAVLLDSVNAKDTTINLGNQSRFKTLTFRSIDGSLTGATRANCLASADDLVSGIEEAFNKGRLETLWQKFTNDFMSRMMDGCRLMVIGTRWATTDPIGRLINMYEYAPRARFISCPALDENGESNFVYMHNKGFSTEYLLKMKATMDAISFECLYQQRPIDRDNILYPACDINRFVEKGWVGPLGVYVEPNEDPDAIWGICDTKDKGSDFCAFLIAYQYGDKFLIKDVVFDDTTDYDVIDDKIETSLVDHNPQLARFESNVAGGRIADNMRKRIAGKCSTVILTKYTTQNKETKILVHSEWVKKHVYFKLPEKYSAQDDYGKFMKNLCEYTTQGKVLHDDAADVVAMLSDFIGSRLRVRTAVYDSPI